MKAKTLSKAILISCSLLIAVLFLNACTNPTDAKRVLEAAGYTNVQILGYDWLNYSQDDHYHDKFSAIGPTGKPVTGVVCAGLLGKGSTIRID